jgi:nascent polypeptide-associated complex subunit alpha
MNINPKQIQGMMKKMGISQVPIDAKRVIIECEDHNIIIDEPSVMKVNMQGQKTFQISGEEREESTQAFSDEDVAMVVEKTGKSEKEVREFLENNSGDIALAIMELK